MPTTNSQFDLAYVDDRVLKKGLFRLAEAIECIGGQLAHPNRNWRVFALHAAVLLDRIQQEFPDVFAGNPWWKLRVPGLLKQYVVRQHPVNTAAMLLCEAGRLQRSSSGPFVCDELLQALDAVIGEEQ